MTLMLFHHMCAILENHDLFVLTCRLSCLTADLAIKLLKGADGWLIEGLVSFLVVYPSYVTRCYRSILNYSMHLFRIFDFLGWDHPAQL